ncbi:MAG: HPr family phosphocarrier protein [bacterium]|nr:HPr family phosphocarrier protein [bacterium]
MATERRTFVCNKLGLHARAAAKFVQLSTQFESDIYIRCRDLEVDGKSIMGVMMLAASPGAEVTIRAEGPDASAAVDALVALLDSRFGEEG